ncbi:transposase [Neobacillus mesonae]|uniref:transposase n=1 Tax=Neobacillus mesonae TaxID=1193713 RepID=UPI0022A8DEC4|nr:transposase [Neobacillus mesonae]
MELTRGRVCFTSQKRYNQEFKQTVVELYGSGTTVSQLSSEYGVSEVTIYKWIKHHSLTESQSHLNFNINIQTSIRTFFNNMARLLKKS